MRFEYYHEPSTVDECIALLYRYGPDASLLAGGTDLVPRLTSRELKKKAVISLGACEALKQLRRDPEGNLEIGAMKTLREIASSALLTGGFEIIRQGASSVSSMQVRNIATLGGNSCNASPSADTVPGLIALDAMVRIQGTAGERCLAMEDFFLAPGETALQRGEMLRGFYVPALPPLTGGAYKKHAIRGNTDLAIVGVGARLTLDKGHMVRAVRIVLGGVAPTPVRTRKAEASLQGRAFEDARVEEAAGVAAEACDPITDQRASAQYRKDMVSVWTRHALREAFEKAWRNSVDRG